MNIMRGSKLNIMQVSFLPELITLAKEKGICIDKIVKKSSISKFDLSHQDKYVPVNSMYEFLISLEHKLDGLFLSNEFRPVFNVVNLGSYGSNFMKQPDLLKGFQQVEAFQEIHKTNLIVEFKIESRGARLNWYFTDRSSEGRTLMEQITFAQLMDAFDLVNSNRWKPIELNFTSSSTKIYEHILPQGNYKINCKQRFNSLLFPTSLLLSNLNFFNDYIDAELSIDTGDIPTRIQLLLQNSHLGRIMGIDDCSDFFNLSQRHIRRILSSHNTSFSEISARVQYLKAIHMLEEGEMSIKEISQALGYANCSNFIRVFKKWSNTTPVQYRTSIN